MIHPDSKMMLAWRGIAGFLALGFTAYGLVLLSAAIADRTIALLFAGRGCGRGDPMLVVCTL
jgi:hypothetical protein